MSIIKPELPPLPRDIRQWMDECNGHLELQAQRGELPAGFSERVLARVMTSVAPAPAPSPTSANPLGMAKPAGGMLAKLGAAFTVGVLLGVVGAGVVGRMQAGDSPEVTPVAPSPVVKPEIALPVEPVPAADPHRKIEPETAVTPGEKPTSPQPARTKRPTVAPARDIPPNPIPAQEQPSVTSEPMVTAKMVEEVQPPAVQEAPIEPVVQDPPAPTPVAPVPEMEHPAVHVQVVDVTTAASKEDSALLAQARSSLARGDAQRARRVLAEHRSRFPSTLFGEEREALDILSLVALGRVEEARAAAKAFKARHPQSLMWPAIEKGLGTAQIR